MNAYQIISLAYSPFAFQQPHNSLPETIEALIKSEKSAYEISIGPEAIYSWNQVKNLAHPWPHGIKFWSPGGCFVYEVVGPCCQLYDREQLPYPQCNLAWAQPDKITKWGFQPVGKIPSWNRVGRRFVPDMGAKLMVSYGLKLYLRSAPDSPSETVCLTRSLPIKLADLGLENWWYSKLRLLAKGDFDTLQLTA